MVQRGQMDANKLAVLRKIQYRLRACCGLCKNGTFPSDNWGICAVQTYDHLKHGNTRQLSVHKAGVCSEYEISPSAEADLGAFVEFML